MATAQFVEVPYLTARSQNKGHPSTQSSNPPPLEGIPNAPIRQGTPWPNTGSASENVLETRKDRPIPPTPALTLTVKIEAPPQVAVIPWAMVTPKQVTEKHSLGPHCPICKNEEEYEEVWDGNMQREHSRMCPQNTQHPSPKALIPPSPKTYSNPSHKTLSTPATEQNSTPSHLMSLTDMPNK